MNMLLCAISSQRKVKAFHEARFCHDVCHMKCKFAMINQLIDMMKLKCAKYVTILDAHISMCTVYVLLFHFIQNA